MTQPYNNPSYDPGFDQGNPPYSPQEGMGQTYGQGYGHPQYFPTEPVNPEKNGFGLTAVILGPIGILFGFVPFTGFLAVAIGIVGVALAFAGLSRVRKNKATNKKSAISGLILSLIAIGLGIWGIVIVFTAVDNFDKDMHEIGNNFNTLTECLDRANTDTARTACYNNSYTNN